MAKMRGLSWGRVTWHRQEWRLAREAEIVKPSKFGVVGVRGSLKPLSPIGQLGDQLGCLQEPHPMACFPQKEFCRSQWRLG